MKNETKLVNSHPNKIGIKEGIGYMFGDMGNLFVLSFVTTFLKVFYTDVLLIDPQRLVALFLVVRLWDAVNDPMWGIIVDSRKPGKGGKFRPYLKAVCIPLAASAALCFVNIRALGITGDRLILLYAYISYTLFGMLYTGMNIPYGSLASVITDDPKGRTMLSTFRSIGGGIGGAPITILLPMILYVNVEVKGETLQAFSGTRVLIAGIAVAAVTILSYMSCYAMTKERVKSPENPPKIELKVTYGSLAKSLPFISLTVASLFMSGMIEYQSMFQYLYKGYFMQPKLVSLQTVSHYLPMIVMIFFAGRLTERFGKKELCGLGLGITVVASIAMLIVHPSPDQLPLFLVFSFANGLGLSVLSIVIWAMVMDVIDYQEYMNGRRDEGSIYATYTFARKLGQTFASSGGMALLAWTGYNGEELIQATGVGDRIFTMCTVVPIFGYGVMFVLIAFVYPLTKGKLETMRDELAQRRKTAETECLIKH